MPDFNSFNKPFFGRKLFFGLFEPGQLCDCQRTPAYPEAGKIFRVHGFDAPKSRLIDIRQEDLPQKLFYFEIETEKDGLIKKMSLWMADQQNPLQTDCVAKDGAAYGVYDDGLLYVSDRYGYYVSFQPLFDYSKTDRVSWTPAAGRVVSVTELGKSGRLIEP